MMNSRKMMIGAGAAGALLLAAATPSLALQATGGQMIEVGDAGNLAASTEAKAAAQLAAMIKAEIASQPATASAEDLEGIIVFVISQGTYPDSVIGTALASVDSGASDSLHRAVENVRIALLKKKLRRGTAALGDGSLGYGAGLGNGGGFTSPGVSTGGGGSSNYSS